MNDNNYFSIPLWGQLILVTFAVLARTFLLMMAWNCGITYLFNAFGFIIPHFSFGTFLLMWLSINAIFRKKSNESIDPKTEGTKYLNYVLSRVVGDLILAILIFLIHIIL